MNEQTDNKENKSQPWLTEVADQMEILAEIFAKHKFYYPASRALEKSRDLRRVNDIVKADKILKDYFE